MDQKAARVPLTKRWSSSAGSLPTPVSLKKIKSMDRLGSSLFEDPLDKMSAPIPLWNSFDALNDGLLEDDPSISSTSVLKSGVECMEEVVIPL